MRFLRVLVVLVLIGSILLNVVLYLKARGSRTQLRVGGVAITAKQLNDFMMTRYGVAALAAMTRQELVRQACEASKIPVDSKEIDQLVADMKESNPMLATLWAREPFREQDTRKELEYAAGLINLRIRDIKATDEELREYFARFPGRWDTPEKYEIKVVRTDDPELARNAEQLLRNNVTDMVVLQRQLDPTGGRAQVLGLDNKFVVRKPYGRNVQDELVQKVAAAPDGGVFTIRRGNVHLVVRRVGKIPGKPAKFEEVKKKVERAYKLERAMPDKEVLRKLWDTAKIETETPTLKEQMEFELFREPVASQGTAAAEGQ